MNATPPTEPIAEAEQFRAKRLNQAYWICLSGITLAIVSNWYYRPDIPTFLVLFTAEIALIYGLISLQRLQSDLAAAILLWTLSLAITASIVINSGLRDPALMAYPAILIFAALFSKRALFFSLFLFVLSTTTLVGMAHIFEWHRFKNEPINWTNITDILIILTAIGVIVRFQAFDLRDALQRLESENEKFKISEAKALHLAQYDKLTDLPNRGLCEDRFNQQLQALVRRGGHCALLFVDLDNFKTINDSLGHAAGDIVLQNVATRIVSSIRSTDTACRFGGDEFIVLLSDLKDIQEIEKVAHKILRALAKPIKFDQHLIETSASIGITIAPQDGNDFGSYCKNADVAMYQAKSDGKNLCRFFDPSMNKLSKERFHLITGLRNALKRGEFRLFYQPKMCLHTGHLVGAEALLRWQHPDKGLLAPAHFIELAEETGLINDIGKWVLHQACEQCKRWHTNGFSEIDIAVNLSPVQFSRGNLEKEVLKALKKSGLDGKYLELELTESLLLHDAEKVKQQVNGLRAHGVTFSIDDFGTGYSNLGYLSKFDIEALKIDQSFIRKLLNSKQDLNIVIAIINIAKSLGLATVAEGIEDAAVLERIKELGCDLGQGYLWSKPLPEHEFTQLMLTLPMASTAGAPDESATSDV